MYFKCIKCGGLEPYMNIDMTNGKQGLYCKECGELQYYIGATVIDPLKYCKQIIQYKIQQCKKDIETGWGYCGELEHQRMSDIKNAQIEILEAVLSEINQ